VKEEEEEEEEKERGDGEVEWGVDRSGSGAMSDSFRGASLAVSSSAVFTSVSSLGRACGALASGNCCAVSTGNSSTASDVLAGNGIDDPHPIFFLMPTTCGTCVCVHGYVCEWMYAVLYAVCIDGGVNSPPNIVFSIQSSVALLF